MDGVPRDHAKEAPRNPEMYDLRQTLNGALAEGGAREGWHRTGCDGARKRQTQTNADSMLRDYEQAHRP